MTNLRPYGPERALFGATVLVSVLGFWEIFFGADAAPNVFHLLHVTTNATWLGLVLYQLRLVTSKRFGDHRRVGLAIVGVAPLLVATTALLSVRSALKGIVSGEGDFLIIQNIGVTFELAVLILLAFVLRKRRKLHGAFLMSTCIMFMGIALFFPLNELVRSSLDKNGLIESLTAFVARMDQPLTFVGSFVLFSGLLVATGVLRSRQQVG